MNGGDWTQDHRAKAWLTHVVDDVAPEMAKSMMVMSLVPEDRTADVKFWVELGACICMDKPLLLVVMDDQPLPPKLEQVADEIVRLSDDLESDASKEKLGAALERFKSGQYG